MENIELIKNNGEQILQITPEQPEPQHIEAGEYSSKLKKRKEILLKQIEILEKQTLDLKVKVKDIDDQLAKLLEIGVKPELL